MRTLGKQGPSSFDIGLGCMGMSDFYGPADRTESIATIHEAIDKGMNLLDTGDYYGMGHNEMLIAEAMKERKREDVIISVKFGAMRDPSGNWLGYDARPVAMKNSLSYTLKRLQTDYIDIYRPGRVDPNIPIEDTIGAIADMIKAGFVKYIGLSEAGAATLRKAQAVHPISDLQIEYSIISRGIEKEILPVCRELGIGITAYGVLSRGLISGHWSKDKKVHERDFRSFSPRFLKENIEQNLKLVDKLNEIAKKKSSTVAQVAIAWVLAQGKDIVPLVGARTRERLSEALGALKVNLDSGDLAEIEKEIPIGAAAGERYVEQQMNFLDSEK